MLCHSKNGKKMSAYQVDLVTKYYTAGEEAYQRYNWQEAVGYFELSLSIAKKTDNLSNYEFKIQGHKIQGSQILALCDFAIDGTKRMQRFCNMGI